MERGRGLALLALVNLVDVWTTKLLLATHRFHEGSP
jgi:hypothetical protein